MTTRAMNHMRRCVLVLALVLAFGASAPADMYGPTPYLQSSDSPFSELSFSSFYLEDFEDGFNTPGVTASSGYLTRSNPSFVTYIDSVDADDGTLDGYNTGFAGDSWFTLGGTGVTFTFDADVLGWLPTHAGIVWTDGYGATTFEAFDAAGVSLGIINAGTLGTNGVWGGQTGEDRFFGVSNLAGIGSIKIIMPGSGSGMEVDHLQFGVAAVPLPGAAILCMLGLEYAGMRLRRHT